MKKKSLSVVACIACIIASCGLFSPRVVELPGGDIFMDNLHLASILDGTGQHFLKTNYEDILHPECTFIDYNNDSTSWSRDRFISKLNQINAAYDTVACTWDTCGEIEIREGDTAMTIYRFFRIEMVKAGVSTSDSGKVQFYLRFYSEKNTWTIRSWREGAARSIFHPE
jgi:hypothetical protein